MNKKIENRKIKGFTLVETLVAISILSLSILTIFTVTQASIQSSTVAKDQIVASYLAQEGMEYIKNIRDENALFSADSVASGGSPRSWLFGLSEVTSDPCWFGGGGTPQKTCKIDAALGSVTECSAGFGSCAVLRQSSTSGLFGYTATSDWTATPFKREIQLVQNSNTEISVTILISWTTRTVSKSFQIKQLLFDRQ